MLHSMSAATALAVVLAVSVPFVGGPLTPSSASSATVGGHSPSTTPVIVEASDAPEAATTLLEFVQRSVGVDEDETSDRDGASQDPEGTEPGASSSSSSDAGAGSSGTGTSASGSGAGSSSTGSSTSGSTGSNSSGSGSSAPAPAPAPPPPPPAPVCPSAIGGSTPGAPGRASALGVAGTTSGDLQAFADKFNAIRVANCLPPVPYGNIRYDSCMEDRLFWMAEDPSTDPMSAWGHIGSVRSDGVPSVGCDGNLAGGSNNSGASVAQKWWDSTSHRASLYKPTYTGSTAGVCILFAMTHGGVPNEPYSFTRAAARWVNC